MDRTISRRFKAGALAVGVAGAVGFVAAGSAPADAERGLNQQITMEFDGNSAPRFEGPKTVVAGEGLQIVNNSNPELIGPHTFTLIDKKEIPGTKKERKDCFKGKAKVCKRIYKAHEVDFENEMVGQPDVEIGKVGWDKSFNNKKDGDSWFTGEQNDSTQRDVSAKVGSKLFYFCVIHPEMVGKTKVVDPQ